MNIKVKLSLAGNLKHFGKSAGDIVTVPFEDYIKAVVASEVGNAPLEACRAQAVAARTFAYPSARDGKVITDTGAHDQAFIAARITNSKTYPNAHQGTEDTAGLVLTYQGKHIGKSAHYSSANNGTTKNRKHKWPNGTDVPYLVLRPDYWTYQELELRRAAGQTIRFGHGVGLSQYGIMYAARQGIAYPEMLAFYYPGCEIVNLNAPVQVPVALPVATIPTPAQTNAQRMTDYARSKVGGKYVYGASGPVNFDCSGFTKRIAQQLGFSFYHGATTSWLRGFQSGNAKEYGYWADSGTIDTLPPGATVFLFNQDKTETRRLVMAHTGYLDGVTGNVIQAGGYGGRGVHENPLDKRRWTHWAILKGTEEERRETPMTTILRRGSVGQAVKEMQTVLLARGFDLGSYGADGKFGAKTETAVMAFQRLNGLPISGSWGQPERQALEARPQPAPGSSGNDQMVLVSRAELTNIINKLQGMMEV